METDHSFNSSEKKLKNNKPKRSIVRDSEDTSNGMGRDEFDLVTGTNEVLRVKDDDQERDDLKEV